MIQKLTIIHFLILTLLLVTRSSYRIKNKIKDLIFSFIFMSMYISFWFYLLITIITKGTL
jgi:hypothetical protein